MKTGAIVVAMTACLFVAKPALSAAAAKTLDHNYTVAVDVDPLGHVAQTRPAADTPAPIAAVLDQAAKQWHFVPVQRDGNAVPVHSYLVAKVQALPQGPDKFAVRVSYVSVGPIFKSQKPGTNPNYPEQVWHALAPNEGAAVVVVDLELPPGGKLVVTRAIASPDGGLRGADKRLLVAAVRRYYEQGSIMPELVDGQPVFAKLQTSMSIQTIEAPVSADEAALLAKSGQKSPNQPATDTGSVLKPSMVEPVMMLQP
jgi:hypothetical protein